MSLYLLFFNKTNIFKKYLHKNKFEFEFNFVKSEHIDIKSNSKKRKHTVAGNIFIRFKAEHISRRIKNLQAKDLVAFESPSRDLHENFLHKAIANSENCNAQQISIKFSSKMFAAKIGTQHISGTKVSFYVYRVKRKKNCSLLNQI